MKRIMMLMLMLLVIGSTTQVQAQWGKKLIKKAGESAKRATERNVEKKIDKAVDKAFDGAEDAVRGKGKKDNKSEKKATPTPQENVETADNDGAVAEEPQPKKPAEMSWNKFDFVAGDEIIFEDDQAAEQLGEFPSMWDLVGGECEIAKLDGQNVICMYNGCKIRPLMKDIHNYFGEVFTIEFDYYYTIQEKDEDKGAFYLYLAQVDQNWAGYNKFSLYFQNHLPRWNWDNNYDGRNAEFSYNWKTTSNESRSGSSKNVLAPGEWHHISISFNKRAMKIYSDQVRVANIPNMSNDIGWMQIDYGGAKKECPGYIRNIRIAKGAVPLYDRMMTDGKFITYGITFDVGKSVIKPESMGEINRIVKLMNDNPDLKFSVEGHTDSTGNEASNQTLSEARSKAIVDKLVEMGIAADRLTSSGKGQSSPIADNSTDEGRAKNRRVEFVKQ